MSAYLQFGHQSWNLLDELDLGHFRGIVLSPVNDDPQTVQERLRRMGDRRGHFEVILDPQLYNPASQRGKLGAWRYFPSDLDTADVSNRAWWNGVSQSIVRDAAELGLNAVCSPAHIPRVCSDDYFRFVVNVADDTWTAARAAGIDTLLTCIIRLRELADPRRAFDIASILSSSRCDRVYLMFLSDDIEQRQPMTDEAGLPTAIHLIRLLSRQMRVHVAFTAHDLVMWKFAGATDVSSGKFLNLRRFSPTRWTEEEGGGRQVSYWNESHLLTLIREQDVARLNRESWFTGRSFAANPAGAGIYSTITSGEERAWVQQSWLQYLRWVSNADSSMNDPARAEFVLERADQKWGALLRSRPHILFIDRWNNGEYARMWLNAAREGGHR